MNPLRTPPLRAGSFPLPKEGDSIKTSVFTRPLNRDSSSWGAVESLLRRCDRFSVLHLTVQDQETPNSVTSACSR